MSEFYPRAKGRMADVWAQGVCPICDQPMDHSSDDTEEDEGVELYLDTYSCDYCHILLTYVSPAGMGEYHNVPDKDRRYFIERQI